jgi:hypothetical protein
LGAGTFEVECYGKKFVDDVKELMEKLSIHFDYKTNMKIISIEPRDEDSYGYCIGEV